MTIKLFTQTRKELIFVPIKKRWTHFQTTNHCLCFKSDYDEYLVQDTNGFFHITLGMGELRDFEIVNKLSELKEDQTKEYVQSVDGGYIGKDTTVYHKSKDAFISWLKYKDFLILEMEEISRSIMVELIVPENIKEMSKVQFLSYLKNCLTTNPRHWIHLL